MTDEDVAPAPEGGALKVADGDIPLPPSEMWAELQGEADADVPPPEVETTAPRTQAAPTVAALEFVGEDPPFRRIRLRYPFRFDGVVHEEIVVRRLTVAQMGGFWDGLPSDGRYERTDLYGVMCGLPGSVIRALPEPDGEEVTGVCFDFLPRVFGGASD